MMPICDSSKVYLSLGFGVCYPNTEFYQKRGMVGKRHRGVDFAPKLECQGQPIMVCAPVGGLVVFAGRHTQFGNMVVIKETKDGVEYLHILCHLKQIASTVIYKCSIHKGLIVGIMGSTGTSVSIHTHYQVEKQGEHEWQSHPWILGNWKPISPMSYFEGEKK